MTNQPISRSLHTFAYLILLYAVLACSPTPPSTTCTKQTDCSDNLGYRCELGHCVPNTSPNTTNTTTSTNPAQPPLTPSETDTPDGNTTEATLPDGSTTEATLPDGNTTENGTTEIQPTEFAQDGGSVESEPTETDATEPTPCDEGKTRPCRTKKPGPCADGQQTCQQGVWGDCQETYKPQPEYLACADNIDNDCDGKTDADDTKANGCKWDIGLPAASSGGKIRWIATTPVAGALYVLGEYTGTPVLPIANQQRYTFANTTYKRGFLAKLHPAKYFEWIQVFGPNTRDERFRPTALTYHHNATDPTKSSLFLAGHFGNSIIQSFTTQGTSPLITTTKPLAIFVFQYNTLGQLTAASKMDTYDGTHRYFSANAILHGNNALYVAGGIWAKFEYPRPTDNETTHIAAYNRRHPYIIRFSTNGGLRVENVQFFSPSNDGKSEVFGLAFDPQQQKLFAVGSTAGGLSLQYPPPSTPNVQSAGGHDAFFITLNNDLSSPTIRLFGSTEDDFARGIVHDSKYGFFVFGETSSSNVQNPTFSATFRPNPTGFPAVSLNTKGQRTAFLGRWDASFQAQWIYGAAANNFTPSSIPTTYENEVAATHLALHKDTLYLAGMFRGDLGYYQGPNATPTILVNKSANPNSLPQIQAMFRNRLVDNFLLALDPATGALQSNTNYRIFDNIGLLTPAGLSFDAYGVGYLFRNEADPAFLQATTNFEIFTAAEPLSPYKAEIVKNLLVP